MGEQIRPVTPRELQKAAREHAEAMRNMHSAHQRVARTLARLVEMMNRAVDAPFAGGQRYHQADDAMGELGRAYERVAALFDDL